MVERCSWGPKTHPRWISTTAHKPGGISLSQAWSHWRSEADEKNENRNSKRKGTSPLFSRGWFWKGSRGKGEGKPGRNSRQEGDKTQRSDALLLLFVCALWGRRLVVQSASSLPWLNQCSALTTFWTYCSVHLVDEGEIQSQSVCSSCKGFFLSSDDWPYRKSQSVLDFFSHAQKKTEMGSVAEEHWSGWWR